MGGQDLILTIADLKAAGNAKLPTLVYDYYNEGALELITLRDNEAAYNRFKIIPRVLVDVSDIDTSTTILSKKVPLPFGFSPSAGHRMAHPDGEEATSRAAASRGIPIGLSAFSNTSLEDVIKAYGTALQIWLKGILLPEDVLLAIRYNVDSIIVSNHEGRQLDGVPATIDLLPVISDVAKGRIKIAIDGGVRRGSDIFKALALGADFVFMGRVALWGLAYNGQEGVELAIKILEEELRSTMALAGAPTLKDISRKHLAVIGTNGLLSRL